MSERLIHGRPGSGKSCYCVSLMIQALTDWVRYDNENDDLYNRVIFTNIPLKVDFINAHLRDQFGNEDIDASSHIELLEDSFFKDSNGDYREWWEDFPEGAYIVIDEVHHYLPSSLKSDKLGKELSKSFVNYVSTHRHRQQDIIFLTQHLNNIAPEVKRMAEVVFEVLNIKNTTVGFWPFKVAMQDIDIVREAWGYPVQLAHIKRGVCEANSIAYDKDFEIFILTQTLFSFYCSHTMSAESLDRPSLRLGKVGSVFWLVRRYAYKFFVYAAVIAVVAYCGYQFILDLPSTMSKALVPALAPKPSVSPAVIPQSGSNSTISSDSTSPSAQAHEVSVVQTVKDDTILGFVKGGVITARGVIRQEEHLTIDGEKDYVKNVDVFRGILYLGSGKKIQR